MATCISIDIPSMEIPFLPVLAQFIYEFLHVSTLSTKNVWTAKIGTDYIRIVSVPGM